MAWQFTGRLPVYKQIVTHIRADILSGAYRAEQQIPPVRQLAVEAGVNPNTMQRAMADLEAEGLLVSHGTIGRFVTSDTVVLERERDILRRETVERLLAEAQAAGITRQELIDILTQADDCLQINDERSVSL